MTDEKIEDILDDDQIRAFFKSRDPNRRKIDPFIDEEMAEEYGGKASTLIVKEEEEQVHGVSFSEHNRHIKSIAFNFTWIGMSIGFLIAIILAIIL